jgi:hypothetical protein
MRFKGGNYLSFFTCLVLKFLFFNEIFISVFFVSFSYTPLHAAGYYLNPEEHYSHAFKADFEVKDGMYECLKRMVGNRYERIKIDARLEEFKSKAGMFGGELATCALKTKTSAKLWESYGDTRP